MKVCVHVVMHPPHTGHIARVWCVSHRSTHRHALFRPPPLGHTMALPLPRESSTRYPLTRPGPPTPRTFPYTPTFPRTHPGHWGIVVWQRHHAVCRTTAFAAGCWGVDMEHLCAGEHFAASAYCSVECNGVASGAGVCEHGGGGGTFTLHTSKVAAGE